MLQGAVIFELAVPCEVFAIPGPEYVDPWWEVTCAYPHLAPLSLVGSELRHRLASTSSPRQIRPSFPLVQMSMKTSRQNLSRRSPKHTHAARRSYRSAQVLSSWRKPGCLTGDARRRTGFTPPNSENKTVPSRACVSLRRPREHHRPRPERRDQPGTTRTTRNSSTSSTSRPGWPTRSRWRHASLCPSSGDSSASTPVVRGNVNAYVYPNDPINSSDIPGLKRYQKKGHSAPSRILCRVLSGETTRFRPRKCLVEVRLAGGRIGQKVVSGGLQR